MRKIALLVLITLTILPQTPITAPIMDQFCILLINAKTS